MESLAASLVHDIAKATDVGDIISLADPTAPGFRLAKIDEVHGITMHVREVPSSPIHLMRASVSMPCTPREFLRYLDLDLRLLWDEYFLEGSLRRSLDVNDIAKTVSSISTLQRASSYVSIQFKHVGFRSPVPLLSNRDFEFVIVESVDEATATATLKAVSASVTGTVYPANDERYIRGRIDLSGFVAKPCTYVDTVSGATRPGCQVTYIALVNPMGLIPPFVVNVVIGKQASGLVGLQRFIRDHPLTVLHQRQMITALTLDEKMEVGRVYRRRKQSKL